uniref:SET and MYND domain-containing protein 4-like isoform X2 n=1 Tax=Vespula vulgaris TaxID=7454 RepID=UPI00223B0F61|nr:SET and MYND domain-containing protein 4-like isoform X2 [Vespula vulgaris]
MEFLYKTICDNIIDTESQLQFLYHFNILITNEERIISTLIIMKKFSVFLEIRELSKNSAYSIKFRLEGNKLFLSSSLNGYKCIKVIELYTKSIAYANPLSEELALAYGNRSAVLLKIHKYELCIQDIDRALSLNYPDQLKIKLYIRKVECLVLIGESSIIEDYENALYWLNKMPRNDPNKKIYQSKLEYLYEQSKKGLKKNKEKQQPKNQHLCKIKSRNTEVPCASDAVAIKYNNTYGRHIVATRDISPGEVIAIEKPYSFLLKPENIYTHCSNCMEVSLASIPCDHCVYAMYCSEKCKLESWKKYHDMECPVFSVFFAISDYIKLDLFSLRIMIQAIKEARNFKNLRKWIKHVDEWDDPRTKGFCSDKKLHSDRYVSVYSLTTNTEKRSVIDLFKRSIDSCVLLYILATRTTICGHKLERKLSALLENENAILIGGLILQHQQMIPNNALSFLEEYGLDGRERGIVVMPFYSLFNHSCNPNVVRYSRSKEVIMRAIFPIKKGEQLFDNYGQHYAIIEQSRRRANFLQQYYFLCKCSACKSDLPQYNGLYFLEVVQKQSEKVMIKKILKKLEKYMSLAIMDEVDNKEHIIKELSKMIQVIHDHVSIPSKEINDIVETLKRMLCLTGNKFVLPKI